MVNFKQNIKKVSKGLLKMISLVKSVDWKKLTYFTKDNAVQFISLVSGEKKLKMPILLSPPVANHSTRASKEAVIEIPPCKLHRLSKAPPTTAKIITKDALQFYETMLTMRKIETSAVALYKEKLIRGFCHMYTGQEAVAVGMFDMIRDVDTVITSYRCHAWTYIMGGSALRVLAELTGKQTGCSRGKGGSMHMYGPQFFGGNGIVGAQIPLGAGLAFAHKYKNDGGIAYTIYGDGASNQGQFFEATNMAYLWKLPCAFICENNLYGLGTSAERSSANTEYYKRGDVIPGIWVDGMDVLACREATRFVSEFVSSGQGPIMVEFNTYRYVGHSMSDPGTSYRTREEVAQVRKTRDPIVQFRDKIIAAKVVTENDIKKIDKKVSAIIQEAMNRAKTDPEVHLEELVADVYFENKEETVRGALPTQLWNHLEIERRK